MNAENENLTERITIRMSSGEMDELSRLAKMEGDRKASTFARRVLTLYLRSKKGSGASGQGGLKHVLISEQFGGTAEPDGLLAAENRGGYSVKPKSEKPLRKR